MEIVSRKHPVKFYLTIILLSLFFLGIGSVFLLGGETTDKAFVFFILFAGFAALLNYLMIKNSPKIVLSKKGIFYKKKFYDWDSIEYIKLTGKSNLYLGSQAECTTLAFKNSKPIYIFDNFYGNSGEMKYFMQEVVINKKDSIENLNKNNRLNDLNRELFIPYKGHPIFSFRGIFMWGLILFLLIMPFYLKRKLEWDESYLFLLGFSLFWFIMNSSMMHYFEISKNYFVIRNHYFFWVKKAYPISELKEIVFEQQGKMPNSLRLITTKFESKLFMAGSLRDKTWLKMKAELERKNILVRNECI